MLALVVEDDQDWASLIEFTLQRGGHNVVVAQNCREARNFVARRTPELAILDVMLPDGSGFELCSELKSRHEALNVLFLSSADSPLDVVQGLGRGGDDYLSKPFHPGELLARVEAVGRRGGGPVAAKEAPEPVLQAGDISVDPQARTVESNGRRVRCTPTEAQILSLFLTYPGEPLSHSFLTTRIWGYSNVDDSELLKGHVSSLRKKLREIGVPPSAIHTVHNVGYMFKAEEGSAKCV